jgi:uncharacterized protein YegP (UPF0339 family)
MRIEMYQDAATEWRWRLRAPNGRILCDGAEGYSSKPGVRRAIAAFAKHLCAAIPVEEVRVRANTAQTVIDKSRRVRVNRPRAEARKVA